MVGFNTRRFVIVSVIVFLVLFSFVHFAFRSDARPVDGDLTVGYF